MCGIVGLVGSSEAGPRLLEGLRRLEYRGYDSAGIATVSGKNMDVCRAEGKLVNLESALSDNPLTGNIGIGHTRWATHGAPTRINAHPHCTDRVSVVHNGIIENFKDIRKELEDYGHNFCTDTDSEVIPHLIDKFLNEGLDPVNATKATLGKLEGAFALGIIFAEDDGLLIGARRGSPLAVGHKDGESFLASDAIAMVPFTRRISYLEEGDLAVLRPGVIEVFDSDDMSVLRVEKETIHEDDSAGMGGYSHFMEKEIHEQPRVIGDTLNTYYNPSSKKIILPGNYRDLSLINQMSIVACGTSFYAGMTARYWLEALCGIPTTVDIASEFRYRAPLLSEQGTTIFISQSGETADTLAALRYAKDAGQYIISMVNVPESTMARESDSVLPTHAGSEIGVASTKAFTTQLTALACFALVLARLQSRISSSEEKRIAGAISGLPAIVSSALENTEPYRKLGKVLSGCRTVLYLGRGSSYPIALEGALKLKEISYIHAEGFAAGEMKHGPIALIEKGTPVIVVAPPGKLFEKTASNVQEANARGAKIILISDNKGISVMGDVVDTAIELPHVENFIAPILYTIPIQLLAYYTALFKGTDIDQPRNLAKSVTVE